MFSKLGDVLGSTEKPVDVVGMLYFIVDREDTSAPESCMLKLPLALQFDGRMFIAETLQLLHCAKAL